ncbi:hypothetical protein ACJX0J_038000, partial [Zea mays]
IYLEYNNNTIFNIIIGYGVFFSLLIDVVVIDLVFWSRFPIYYLIYLGILTHMNKGHAT